MVVHDTFLVNFIQNSKSGITALRTPGFELNFEMRGAFLCSCRLESGDPGGFL